MSNKGEEDDDELASIIDELLQRLSRGDWIDWPLYFERYPRHAERLTRLAPVMEAVVKVLLEQAD